MSERSEPRRRRVKHFAEQNLGIAGLCLAI